MFHSWKKGGRPRVADFIHGSDGLGNIFLPPPERKKIEKNASEFLVDMVSEYPGEVSILALGPLTNLALVSWSIIFPFLCLPWASEFLLAFPNMCIVPCLGNQKRFFLCEKGQEGGRTWWCFLCTGKCKSCCGSKCKCHLFLPQWS